jgi:hypothetical protein
MEFGATRISGSAPIEAAKIMTLVSLEGEAS